MVLPSELDENTLHIAAEILSSIQLYNSRLIPVEIIFGGTHPNNLLSPSSIAIGWNPNYYPEMWNYHWTNFIQIPKLIEHTLSSSEYLNLNLLQKIPVPFIILLFPLVNLSINFSFLSYHTPYQFRPIGVKTIFL